MTNIEIFHNLFRTSGPDLAFGEVPQIEWAEIKSKPQIEDNDERGVLDVIDRILSVHSSLHGN